MTREGPIGRDAMREHYLKAFFGPTGGKPRPLRFEQIAVRPLGDDHALITGRFIWVGTGNRTSRGSRSSGCGPPEAAHPARSPADLRAPLRSVAIVFVAVLGLRATRPCDNVRGVRFICPTERQRTCLTLPSPPLTSAHEHARILVEPHPTRHEVTSDQETRAAGVGPGLAGASRRCASLDYKLGQLREHVVTSSHLLNDLRTLRPGRCSVNEQKPALNH